MEKPTSTTLPLICLVAALAWPGWAAAQEPTLLGMGAFQPVGVAPSPAPSPAPVADTRLEGVLAKIRAGDLITEREYVIYLLGVEAKNPGMSWAQISTKMHDAFYEGDAALVIGGITFLRSGPENAGWEKVDILGMCPKYAQNAAGEKVDMGHAICGVRALVERGNATGFLFGHANTGVGDAVQVISGEMSGAYKYLVGALTFDYQKAWAGADQMDNAPRFLPPDQVRGNQLGMKVLSILAADRTKKLSDAFSKQFFN